MIYEIVMHDSGSIHSLSLCYTCITQYLQTARFQTIKNTLELIYSQAIVWFGTFFCPPLAAIAVFKTIVLFYVKEYVTLKWCAPPLKAFRVNRSFHSLIYVMHLVTLVCIMLPLGYTIVRFMIDAS